MERALRIRRPGVRNVLMKRQEKKGLKGHAGHGGERERTRRAGIHQRGGGGECFAGAGLLEWGWVAVLGE